MDSPMVNRMFDLMEAMGSGTLSDTDMRFFSNNLNGFVVFLANASVARLVEVHGVEVVEAKQLVTTVLNASRMLGSMEYNDYLIVQNLEEGMK